MNKGYKSRRMKIQPEIEEGNMKCHQCLGNSDANGTEIIKLNTKR